ncbi:MULTISPECIES: hypothetical protein [unclassified Arthrobacter]|uniref:hypothetical protein n=1 Tax=unclassified Arthrobacter TaxID=235627 RepID=UPI0027D85011|nr:MULTISPECIES: hypothetical protein [unclassified Arthrobacter]
MLLAVIFFIGAVGCAIAPNTEFIVAARFVLGHTSFWRGCSCSCFLCRRALVQSFGCYWPKSSR